jgi:hypothetical protein
VTRSEVIRTLADWRLEVTLAQAEGSESPRPPRIIWPRLTCEELQDAELTPDDMGEGVY